MDRELAAHARTQHGVVSREQLRALGLGDAAITRRVAAGRLHRIHHGVHAVGHTVLTRSGRWMAAVLARGPGAALSHASAAALLALQRGEPTIVDVEVDSWRYHKTRNAFENDRARAVLTTQAGYRTLRFTDRQLTNHPTHVAQAIHAVLPARRAA